jgi:hypothetical protein
MQLGSEDGDLLEIEVADSGLDSYAVSLTVRARFHGFAAQIDTSVQRAAWMGFTQDLVVLEARRQGEARLESMSPGELSLVIRSTDRSGHMGVEATLGSRGFDHNASLHFGVLAFDPSQLPAFVYGAREISANLK